MRNNTSEMPALPRHISMLLDDDLDYPPAPILAAAAAAITSPTALLPPVVVAAAAAAPSDIPTYTTLHYQDACLNRYYRFMANSSMVTYAVLETFSDQPASVMQFTTPVFAPKPPTAVSSPFEQYTVVPAIHSFTHGVYAHPLPNGKLSLVGNCGDQLMRSRRTYHFTLQEGNHAPHAYTFHPGSPTKAGDFLRFNMPTERFVKTEEARRITANTATRKKTGRDLPLNKIDILERDKIVTRTPDQNKTMGLSAVTEFTNVREQYLQIFTPIMQQILKISAEADLHAHGMAGQTRTEWLHGESYRHTPMASNPQRKENLGAARKCHNTEMMILEGVAKWFALNVACAAVTSDFDFDMLLDTEVIDRISFIIKMKILGFTIVLKQEIDAFCQYPAFAKTSDMAGLIHILTLMIQHQAPRFVQSIDMLSTIPPGLIAPSPLTGCRTTLFVSQKRARDAKQPAAQTAGHEGSPHQ